MANSFTDEVGDGSTTLWSVPFPFIKRADVSVTNTDTEASISFNWISDSQIEITPAVANLTNFRIARTTDRDARVVNHQNGTNLDEATLDLDANQLFYILQELIDASGLEVLVPNSGITNTLPTPVADELIKWNSAGNGFDSVAAADIDLAVVTSFIETLLDDTTAAAARTTLGVDAAGTDNSDADTLLADTTDNLTVGFTTDEETMSYAATLSPDFTAESVKTLTATGNFNLNKPASGGSGICEIRLEVDNASGITVTAGTDVHIYGDTLASIADNSIHYLTCTYYSGSDEMKVEVRTQS